MKYARAMVFGGIGAIAWAWWCQAVAIHSPYQAAVADLSLLVISGISVNFIAEKRYGEFSCYALAAAIGTWVTVYLSK